MAIFLLGMGCTMDIRPRDIEPFDFTGNSTGCLLVHGFTGSPGEMRPLGEYLNSKGFTVKGVCLPGHGTQLDDMLKTRWEHWYSEVEKGYNTLAAIYEKVFVIGLSMGGALALQLAIDKQISGGIVPICAPIFLTDKKAYLAPLLQYFIKYTGKKSSGQKSYQSFWYDKYPTKCVASLVQMLPKIKKQLRSITCPILVIQSKLDRTVDPISAQYIYDNVTSSNKELKWLYNSGHVATLDIEREQVFLWIEEFITGNIGR